jgi:hypothetical protein
MKYLLVLLFVVTSTMSKKFLFKFINTPIYNSIPICLFHSVVLVEKNYFQNVNKDKTDVFAIDFSPIEDISSPNVIVKLLKGKNIQGMVRVSRLSKEHLTNNSLYSKNNPICECNDIQITNENLKTLETIDPYLVFVIKSWGSSFQIYNRNCRHFSHFLKTQYFQPSDNT